MADVLLVFSITCFAVGLTFSALITYRDFRALRERQRFISVPWQIALVTFDLVQDGLLLCCLGLTIFMMKSHRLNWAEPIASSAVQFMSATNIRETQERAHGTLPNTPLPAHLSKEGITNFKLVAFNELFEVAFFFELVQNITNNVDGYDLGEGRDEILEDLTIILAVEYNFPVSDYKSAVALAATFTDVVLGALQDVNDIFAQNAENGLVQIITVGIL
ncbi:late sexual development protein [Paraphaeosphaeria minitans]|uniref:Late sexual development protein n=1 Tax=Paraphaeosphaeria minitans TaxID=565426 RepID=A0A9P6KKP2_9PLEO|nr:late sexual development protein [Paraphaeosphaeria minitans]